MNAKHIATAIALATAATITTTGTATASEDHPTMGTSHPEPTTGTSHPQPTTGTSRPVPKEGSPRIGTGGLILRDHNANPTGSGMWENARFKFSGVCITVRGINYIKVWQLDNPNLIEGYGPLRSGFVTRHAANLPHPIPC